MTPAERWERRADNERFTYRQLDRSLRNFVYLLLEGSTARLGFSTSRPSLVTTYSQRYIPETTGKRYTWDKPQT